MRQAAPAVSVIKMYAAREPIQVRAVQGRYTNWRWLCVWLTQCVFYGLPWLTWNGRQAVLFDLAARKFYLFGVILWPQDLIYLALLLIICAYALFLLAALAGRVWCGFACPQTVYTEMFMWIEQRIEGARSARLLLDKQPWPARLAKRSAKHAAWIALSLWTGFTLVGYFTPPATLAAELRGWQLGPWQSFWIGFYALATYGNAGWLREQVCRYMCPYARFQSAMFDPDTLIVSYDRTRGEPRGAQGRGGAASAAAAPAVAARGACIDCTLCVQVCPAGIDIRDGLQYDCIGCAVCIDACDGVMDKIGAARGLVRFTTENALKNNLSAAQIRRRAGRPRVLIYGVILLAALVALFGALLTRAPVKMNVMRDRGSMARELEGGAIENVYRLQIMNADEAAHRYRVSVSGIDGIALAGADQIVLQGLETRAIPVTLRLARGMAAPGPNPVRFTLRALDDERAQVSERASFIVPR